MAIQTMNCPNAPKSSGILIALAALAFGALYLTVPCALDDYWFLREINDFGTNADGSFSLLRGAAETFRIHHLTDNSRLANIVGMFILRLPLIVSALLSTLAVWTTLYFMLKLAKCESFIATTAAVMIFTFALPWHQPFFTRVYAYNYIWGAAITSLSIYLFINNKKIKWIWMLILGIVLGAWHEIFSFPTLVGAVACFILRPAKTRSSQIAFCLGLLAGCAWLWLSPSRTNPSGYGSLITTHRLFRNMIGNFWFPLSFISIQLMCLPFRRFRTYALAPITIFATAFAGICLPVYLLSDAMRVITPAIIICGTATIYILYNASRLLSRRARTIATNYIAWACAAAWVFFIIHICVAFHTGLKIHDQEKMILSEYQKVKNTDGVIFADLTTRDNAPWLALSKPVQNLYTYYAHPILLSKYHHGQLLKVIPTCLKGFTADKGRKIPSNDELYEYKGFLIARNMNVNESAPILNAYLEYPDGIAAAHMCTYKFTGGDGQSYIFLLNAHNADKVISAKVFH